MSGDLEEAQYFYGPKGRTVFFMPFLAGPELKDWNSEVPTFLQRVEKTGDDRSYTILSATMIEYHIDRILSLIMPDFEIPTFALKLRYLRSLKLIPEHLLTNAETINAIRNKFAHDMKLDSFDGLDQGTQKKLRKAHQDMFRPDARVAFPLKFVFTQTFQLTFIGIRLYEPNVRLLVEAIHSEKFHEELRQTARVLF